MFGEVCDNRVTAGRRYQDFSGRADTSPQKNKNNSLVEECA
jgi:hypothetical protein